MWDLILDLLVMFGWDRLKGQKKEKTQPDSESPSEADHAYDANPAEQEAKSQEILVCAGCSRKLKEQAVRELGKVWCTECYKSLVLKIKG